MKFVFTQHAKDVLLEREILPEWVTRVVDAPDRAERDKDDPELEHRLGRVAERGNRVLRVVVNVKAKPARVVTAYFDRTARDLL